MNKLILLRHGQSIWNLENRFTGWKDIPLSDQGIREAKASGRLMKSHNIAIDLVFSSVLQRANETAKLAISEMSLNHLWNEKKELIMNRDQALNERNYGDLVGLNKQETSDKYGKEQVHTWRRSYNIPPPGGESLKTTSERVLPYFEKKIMPSLTKNQQIIVCAHGNSLRALVMKLDELSPEEVTNLEIKTGAPICYKVDGQGQVKNKELMDI